ncbi:hypothetical protein BUALT_Bualt14G0101100 [Buddleja alternifolia]|uniref:Transposase (putative) gypsy type domain-containing protein n=1 Tax=Buddleja alternifolia TaxID=168488 RepID=A0AAV6WTG5_9LAMI|nr:hypothetical protein BUALT_Bualt14G0101100 [Buddleja alternifolia]
MGSSSDSSDSTSSDYSGSSSNSTSTSEDPPSSSSRPLGMGLSKLQVLHNEPLDVICESPPESDSRNVVTTSSEFESIITVDDLAEIRKEFYIPLDFELIAPKPGQYMFDSPPDCRAFHLTVLEAGVRFPLSGPLVDILTHLDLCPTQLLPNSYRQILAFIIIMRFFDVDSSWKHFLTLYSLISSPQSSGNSFPFFYLSPRPSCKFLTNLPNSLGDWKESFIFIKSPPELPWQVPYEWRRSKPKLLSVGDVTWGPDFIEDFLTLTWFDAKRLLSEEVLRLAEISPVTIPLTQSLDMAARDAMVANKMREESERLLALGRSRRAPVLRSPHSNLLMPPPSDFPRGSAPPDSGSSQTLKNIDRGSGPSDLGYSSRERVVTEKRGLHETGKGPDSGSKVKKSQKRKDDVFEDRDEVKKTRSDSKGKAPEGSLVLPDKKAEVSPRSIEILHKWYDDSRARFRGPRAPDGGSAVSPYSEPKGAPYSVDWSLTNSSSLLDSRPGETSYELYKSLILPKDEAALFPLDYFQVEDRSAHHLMLASLHLRQLTLKCAYWHHEFRTVDKRLRAFESDRSNFPTLKRKLEADNAKILATLEVTLKREEEKVGVLAEAQARVSSLELDLEEVKHKFAAMTSLLEEEKQKAYARGRQEEQAYFFQSSTYHDLEKRLKMEGAQEFQRSSEFDNILLSKAAEDTYLGFIKCQDQFVALDGVKDGFDLSTLKPFEDIVPPGDLLNDLEEPTASNIVEEISNPPAV